MCSSDLAESLNVLGNKIAVKAKIHTLGGFSAHAGQTQLLAWAKQFEKPRPQLYLIHGEIEKMQALQEKFDTKLGWKAHIPDVGDVIQLH
mgnify:FL=1